MSFKDIGLKIQLAREEKNMSQEQLSRLLGCSQSALSNYEKGKRRLYLSHLEKLAEILDKPLDYFVENWASNNSRKEDQDPESDIINIINSLYQLEKEDRDDVIRFIEYIKWKADRRE